ncbi:MAG: hypothetical protein ACM3PT_01950 [Deltaproteobacteria bacterium]
MKNIGLIFIVLFSFKSIYSQQNELKLDDVEVIKEFNARIGNFNKVNIDPVLPVYDIKSRKYEYKIRSVPAKLEYEKPKIRPLALKPELPRDVNRFHTLLAYGSHQLLRIDADAFMQKGSWSGGVVVNHISANNEKSLKDQKISVSGLALVAESVDKIRKHSYEINLKANNSYIYLYALDQGDSIYSADSKRRYLSADLSAKFKAEELFPGVRNDAEIRIRTFQFNAKDLSENELIIKNKATYNIGNNSRVELPLNFQSVLGRQDYLMQLKPYFNYSSRPLNLKVGVSMGIADDKKILGPYAEISSNLWHNFIELFAEYSSELYLNNDFQKIILNPFYSFNDINSKTTRNVILTAGLRNSLEGAKIEFKVGYHKFKDHLFFKIDSIDRRTFNSVYDDGTNVRIEAKASYKPLKKFEIGSTVVKNIYQLNNFDKPWYTPDLTANIFANISMLSDKIFIGSELYFGSAPWYEDENGNNRKLKPLLDLNGTVKYFISKKGACFVNLNNIFSQNYYRWYKYPDYGLNLMAGFELRF